MSTQDDVGAAAVDEVGHVTGFAGEWPNATASGDPWWNDATYHTMCDDVHPLPHEQRSLQEHDEHTFTGVYPPGSEFLVDLPIFGLVAGSLASYFVEQEVDQSFWERSI